MEELTSKRQRRTGKAVADVEPIESGANALEGDDGQREASKPRANGKTQPWAEVERVIQELEANNSDKRIKSITAPCADAPESAQFQWSHPLVKKGEFKVDWY
jgi:hypothetical protein